MKILVCNVGSTSLKFKLFDMPQETVLVESKVERIHENAPAIFSYRDCKGYTASQTEDMIETYSEGIALFLQHVLAGSSQIVSSISEIECVCFKTVIANGFYGTHELTSEVLAAMEEFIPVAPAHNVPYIQAIREFQAMIPEARMIGSFETDFHKTIPEEYRTYGIPYHWTENYGLKKMGFHGASHSYIAAYLKEQYNNDSKIISCHLGGSSSLCAIDQGRSVDCSFGFSPQSGLIHAHRSGDLDPAVIEFLVNKGYSFQDVMEELSSHGGLDGISGGFGDFRLLSEAIHRGNRRAQLAFDVYCSNILQYIGKMYVVLGGLHSLVFTGGIGEHSPYLRAAICEKLEFMGVQIDNYLNNRDFVSGLISRPTSSVQVFVIPANEELMVVRKSYQLLLGAC